MLFRVSVVSFDMCNPLILLALVRHEKVLISEKNARVMEFSSDFCQFTAMVVRQALPADAHRIAEIHTASWQTAFRGIMLDSCLDELNVEERRVGWLKNMREYPGNLLVIEDNVSGIRGFSCSGRTANPERAGFDSEVFGLHVAPEAKRCGYGRQLMAASFKRLGLLGCKNAVLWTLEMNVPAKLFYEKLGGKAVDRKLLVFGGKELVEVAYSWDRLVLPEGYQV
jgi:ribosomal protein S18 acetylase RimI-like enzyme